MSQSCAQLEKSEKGHQIRWYTHFTPVAPANSEIYCANVAIIKLSSA